MFVRSRMNKDVIYRTGGKDWVIKALTTTLIDENAVSPRELKSLYGSRIEIISRGYTDTPEPKKAEVKKPEPKKAEVKKPEPPKKLNEALIDDILGELKKEEKVEDKKKEQPKKTTKTTARKSGATKRTTRRSKKQ